MGVLGLAPFLQKHCPEVIKTLPDRLRGLNGKTIVFDGTLITQRLHWAQMPHEHRHVLGWYRLITELSDNGVNAICVFDGKERSAAKALENERRTNARRLIEARGTMEVERLRRLQKLNTVLKAYQVLPSKEQSNTLSQVKLGSDPQVRSEEDTGPDVDSKNIRLENSRARSELSSPIHPALAQEAPCPKNTDPDADATSSESSQAKLESQPLFHSVCSKDSALDIDEKETRLASSETPVIKDQLLEDSAEPAKVDLTAAEDEGYPSLVPNSNKDAKEQNTAESAHADSTDILESLVTPRHEPLPPAPEELVKELPVLYQKYQSSTKQLRPGLYRRIRPLPGSPPASMSLRSSEVSTTEVASTTDEVTESKLQLVLTQEEGQLWAGIESLITQPEDEASTSSTLANLIDRSRTLSDTYERRSKPPSRETYEESKILLDAMGVPCIECDGPYEAEALASSLVHHGVADYVASEDTDVLVYGAPLLRNITARRGALVSISGSEVRTALRLSRASFVDFALLLGTDFSPRLRNLGPTRALRFISAHASIEHVLKHEKRYSPHDKKAYLAQVRLARRVFRKLPPVPGKRKLKARECDRERVTELLSRFGLSRAAIDADWDLQASLAGNYFADSPLGDGSVIDAPGFEYGFY